MLAFMVLILPGAGSRKLCGITLDVSNRYYSVSDIKKYIDLTKKSGKGYVQLHFTGDKNVGIECRYLGQTANKRYRHGSRYYNPKTNRSFLTRTQIRQILKYAKKKKVEIIPEIDMPGHMGGFEKLYRLKYRKTNYRIFNRDYEGELAIGNKAAMNFAMSVYKEYTTLFKGCRYFHIGCDEFWSGTPKRNAAYINKIARYIKKKGFKVWIWNDLFEKTNMKTIDHDVTVTYWSIDGDTENKAEKNARRKVRASFPALRTEGFKLLNYNSYYLYYTPSKKNTNSKAAKYAVDDAAKNWSLLTWDSDSGRRDRSAKNILGACVSIWGEDSKGVSNKKIYDQIDDLYLCVRKKI